ncbi:UDP:flavonoid glycosyltransferase YjiC, YdhE family [Duganella sp. CF402]|uniref:glycosyltransferase n=1 Tax=unclassified Duganella TaxID=2636909 RepID=UPI0008C14BD9|nr:MULTISPECIES: nucleotide disphospho-sugar-binding domain-containing protein [unclassified Duganella]RZT10405.1 UDP:flavonoid glycosyltransferase YjiC (YdhE family) [Duganella sp. BK701]SEL14503.1 UDP:flavonoid glycosyltransferase YjiC, YdhE family [Duganella sp. CF402]
MSHIHLCWELGGGLGHAGRLKMLAQALLAHGHRVTISLRDLMHTHAVLADLDVHKLQAPVWLHKAQGLPPSASLAEIAFHCGYLQASALRGMVSGWRDLFALLQPDLVVGDYAPTALLAARSMGLRSASVSSGFSSPPPGRALPAFQPAPVERLAASEARMLATANAVLAEYGAQPFAHAADVFTGDLPLLCTWPELDPYEERGEAQWLGPSFVAHGGIAPHWPEGDGRKVFAYLKASHAAHGVVLKALVEEGCRVLAYVPEVAAGGPPPLVSDNVLYAEAPVSLSQALAQADLCVCHAGEATLAQSLLAGVPLLMLPSHTEQFLSARRVAMSGAGYNAALLTPESDWRAMIRGLLTDPAYRTAAQAFAARHSGFDQQLMNEELARQLESLLT